MKSISFLSLLCAFLIFSNFQCEKETTALCQENPKKDCVCITLYDPVCGCNEKTYGNSCEAECAGITDYVKGECAAIKNNLKSEWFFIGYLSEDKIDVNSPVKAHKYDINAILKEETGTNGKKVNALNGISSVNLYGGNFEATPNASNAAVGTLKITGFVMTKIAGTPEANQFETKYVERLSAATNYEFLNAKTLKISISTPKGEAMIFTRK